MAEQEQSPYTRLIFFLVILVLISLVAVAVVYAASEEPARLPASGPPEAADQADPTTLSVAIVSAPWAILDHNNPEAEGPHVLVVEAVINNTGTSTATLPVITLDYDEDVPNNWTLLPGEDPIRKVRELPPGEAYHAYWFATYPSVIGVSHVYTVTAQAENADPVSTSQNVFRPTADTVETRRALEGGSTRLQETTSDIIVGVAFTATVQWNLGTNFQQVLLSPVGNVDFNPSAYRLIASKVTFLNGTTPLQITEDRLYFDTIPLGTTHAQGDFIFEALRPLPSRICPYTTPLFSSDFKYDNAYCLPGLAVEGTVSLSMTKQVSAPDILQNQSLTYTIAYTNNGNLPLGNVWIWDDVDPAIGSVIATSIDPPATPGWTTDQRVAWQIGGVAPAGQPGSTGTLTFTIDVNGGGSDLPDQQAIVNHALFGISSVDLPAYAALTSTVTTTLQAPTITVAKTDTLDTVSAGGELSYTLRITNSGSVTATNVVLTDQLPDGVNHPDGPILTFNLDPLPPNGGTGSVTIPATVSPFLPDGTILTNIMTATYENEAGWPFDPATATDETTVSAPFWIMTKSDDPGTVLAGETLTYTLVYYHNGVDAAENIDITDTLPAEVTYGGLVSQPAGWTGPAHDPGPPATLNWYAPTLNAGASGSMVFTVTVNSDAEGLIANNALLSSTTPATSTTTSEDTTVQTEADLEIVKSDDPDPVAAGATLTYILTYTNNGPSDAQAVVLVDTLGQNTTYDSVVSAPPAWGTPAYDPGPPATLTWNAATLAAGDSDAIVFTVIVNANAVGAVKNNVTIASDTSDENLANNTDDETTSIGDPFHATLYGYVFADTNCNGVWDDGETPIPNVTIGLSGPGPAQVPATTDPDGLYYFIVDTPGVYTVLEQDPTGYFSTTPNEVHVAVALGNSYQVDFGDTQGAECAAIYGTVFEDLDSNTLWDELELGIKDVTITLNDSVVTTTGDYGNYTFPTTATGPHSVVETDPAGYMSTTPNEVTVDVALGNGYQVNFGDISFCTCPPDSYEEDDAWTGAVELGLGLSLSQTHDFCDDNTDWTKFTARAGWIYTMTTSSWGQRADTLLYLYDTDGNTLLAASDDYEGTDDYSTRIVWSARVTGVYYLLTANRAGLTGCETDYDVWIEPLERGHIYMPVIMRNYSPPAAAARQSAAQAPAQDTAPASTNLQPALPPAEPEIVLSPSGVITHSCPDTYEIDDTWQLAKPIDDGDLQVHSFDSNPVLYAADKDFVSFSIEAERTVTFTVPAITGTATLLELYDQNGDALNVTGTDQLVWMAPANGRYYLSVSPRLAAYGCADVAGYELKAEMSPIEKIYLPIVLRTW